MRRLLLDTHVLLWWAAYDPRLPEQARALIEDPENTVNVSSVSFWELAIKRAAGKLEIDLPALVRGARDQNLEFLAFHEGHALEVARLPDIHRDPFDRALIAQSRFEPLILVTHDTTVSRYGENVMLI